MKFVHAYAHLWGSDQEISDNFNAIQESEEPWSGEEQMLKSCHQKLNIAHPGLYIQSIIIALFLITFLYSFMMYWLY